MGANDKPLPVSSSVPPQFPAEQRDLFVEVLQLMNERSVPYVVSGAFALQRHTGIWRDTKDLDLFLPGDQAAKALEYLAERGFETEVCDPIWLAKAHRNDYFVDLITGMSNAAIVVDQSWITRGTPFNVLGVQSCVLGAEELLASKLFVTRRERFDGADTVHVIFGTKGKLDWNRVFELVGSHWEMLLWTLVLFAYCYPAHTDYVPRQIWEDLLGRFQRTIRNSNPGAEFRGTLIDEKMFAIDVNEWGLHDIMSGLRDRRTPKIPMETAERNGCVIPETIDPAA